MSMDDMRRIPPQSLQAESSVLGSILIDNEAIKRIVLAPNDFYRESHRKIFSAILDLCELDEPVDLTTLSERLKSKGELEAVGGVAYLAVLADSVPTTVNISHYARIVREQAHRRQAVVLLREGLDDLHCSLEDFSTIKQRLTFRLAQIQESDTRSLAFDGTKWVDSIKHLPAREGIAAPIPTLENLGGLVPGDLVTLAGRPGMGKSTMAWNALADLCIVQHIPTVAFSLEMTRHDVARWVGARLENYAVSSLPRTLPETVLSKLRQAPVCIVDNGTVRLEDIEAIVRSTPNVRLVILDHLTRVVAPRRETRNLEVGEIARRLKSLAKDCRCTVLALCQMNRGGDDGHQPKLSALRESGEIEQESDGVIFNWTSQEDLTGRYLNLAVYLAKNRHGAPKQVVVRWDRYLKTFTTKEGDVL